MSSLNSKHAGMCWRDIWLACLTIYAFSAGALAAPTPTVSVVAASATYPAGTTTNSNDDQETFVSMTDDPLGPFSGQSVMFEGSGGVGGDIQVYLYRLDFDQEVTLDSITVEGAAWVGGSDFPNTLRLLDANSVEIASKIVDVPAGERNDFKSIDFDLTGITGSTLFLEEVNNICCWRYRSNIEINLAVDTSPATTEVSIRALIDGKSQINIQDNQLWWHHFDAAAPGVRLGANEPTTVNGFDWFPIWPFNDEGGDCDCESDKFDLSNAGLQLANDLELLELRVVNARDSATLIQSPLAGNGYLSIIELDDPSGGSTWYEVVAVFGSSSLITVPGTSNPWLAGMPDGSMARGGDVAPDQSPVLAPTAITPGVALSFSATGLASNTGGGGSGPDGDINVQPHVAENGMPDGNMPLNALAGVFLDAGQPDQSPLPPALDFSAGGNVTDGIDYTSLSPQLKQVFFIGDGQTDTGVAQQVTPPAGATRLFLGIMDGSEYNDNSGAFEVEISDGVPPINEIPMAVNDSVNADTGASVVISVLDNDQGLADVPIMVSISADPNNGTAIAGADNNVTYTSNVGFVGDDNFQYTATDRDGDASSATVTVTVDSNANAIPIAVDDMADVDSGETVTVNVLTNDQGLADVPIVISISQGPDNGSAQVLADNRISYTADNNFSGNDSIGYTVTDNDGETSSATVAVTVTDPSTGGVGAIPVANDDSVEVRVDFQVNGNVIIDVLANDQGLSDEPLTVEIQANPINGSVFVLADNHISYTTGNNFIGEDTFQYRVTDVDGDSSIATVTITALETTYEDDPTGTTKKKGGGMIDPLWLLLLFAAVFRSNALRSARRTMRAA